MTAILDIQLDNAQAVAEEILSQGGKKSIAVKMDVTDSQEVKRAVREVEETFGRVDVLINNVGREELGLFIESTEESWDWKIALNLRGPMTVTKAVLEGMVPIKYGRIVNISSDAGRAGQFGEAAYGAAKAGIIALTKVWARELMEHNITVNSVAPLAMTPGSDIARAHWQKIGLKRPALLNCIKRWAEGNLRKWLWLWLSLPRTKQAILPDKPSV